MDELYWNTAIGLGGIFGILVAFGTLHSVVETETGYRPFTRRRLTFLSFVSVLYHGAFYLSDRLHGGKPWAFPAMLTAAAILTSVVIVQNFKNAGMLWGAAVTAAQSLILIGPGPMFAAMLALFVFRRMTKNWGSDGAAAASPAPRPNFLYPNNMPY
jgi:hypothetical protein